MEICQNRLRQYVFYSLKYGDYIGTCELLSFFETNVDQWVKIKKCHTVAQK